MCAECAVEGDSFHHTFENRQLLIIELRYELSEGMAGIEMRGVLFWVNLAPKASLGSNPRLAARSQIAVLGPGGAVVVDARPGSRFMLMAGKPCGEKPV